MKESTESNMKMMISDATEQNAQPHEKIFIIEIVLVCLEGLVLFYTYTWMHGQFSKCFQTTIFNRYLNEEGFFFLLVTLSSVTVFSV